MEEGRQREGEKKYTDNLRKISVKINTIRENYNAE